MRESDSILAADLREAGLEHLAVRAESGEWNDYFGVHDLPQHELMAALRQEIRLANPARRRLLDNITAGKYDGTSAEADEWSRSPEGASTITEFTGREPGGSSS